MQIRYQVRDGVSDRGWGTRYRDGVPDKGWWGTRWENGVCYVISKQNPSVKVTKFEFYVFPLSAYYLKVRMEPYYLYIAILHITYSGTYPLKTLHYKHSFHWLNCTDRCCYTFLLDIGRL